jgi:hypothetical protein
MTSAIFAYLKTLVRFPAACATTICIPFNIRRRWDLKLLFLDGKPFVADAGAQPRGIAALI